MLQISYTDVYVCETETETETKTEAQRVGKGKGGERMNNLGMCPEFVTWALEYQKWMRDTSLCLMFIY